jgi:hypothetical protein
LYIIIIIIALPAWGRTCDSSRSIRESFKWRFHTRKISELLCFPWSQGPS